MQLCRNLKQIKFEFFEFYRNQGNNGTYVCPIDILDTESSPNPDEPDCAAGNKKLCGATLSVSNYIQHIV